MPQFLFHPKASLVARSRLRETCARASEVGNGQYINNYSVNERPVNAIPARNYAVSRSTTQKERVVGRDRCGGSRPVGTLAALERWDIGGGSFRYLRRAPTAVAAPDPGTIARTDAAARSRTGQSKGGLTMPADALHLEALPDDYRPLDVRINAVGWRLTEMIVTGKVSGAPMSSIRELQQIPLDLLDLASETTELMEVKTPPGGAVVAISLGTAAAALVFSGVQMVALNEWRLGVAEMLAAVGFAIWASLVRG